MYFIEQGVCQSSNAVQWLTQTHQTVRWKEALFSSSMHIALWSNLHVQYKCMERWSHNTSFPSFQFWHHTIWYVYLRRLTFQTIHPSMLIYGLTPYPLFHFERFVLMAERHGRQFLLLLDSVSQIKSMHLQNKSTPSSDIKILAEEYLILLPFLLLLRLTSSRLPCLSCIYGELYPSAPYGAFPYDDEAEMCHVMGKTVLYPPLPNRPLTARNCTQINCCRVLFFRQSTW